MFDYLKGYTVTGVTHGHDGHLHPREWVLGLSGMSLRYLLCTRPLEAVTKLEPFWPVTPEPAPQRQSERTSSEVTPATEMGQLRQNFVLQSEAENEIYAGFLVSFSNQKPGMKFTPALFGFPFS